MESRWRWTQTGTINVDRTYPQSPQVAQRKAQRYRTNPGGEGESERNRSVVHEGGGEGDVGDGRVTRQNRQNHPQNLRNERNDP